MTAKEARELAAKQLKTLDGQYKSEFDNIMTTIKGAIEDDPTVTSISVNTLSSPVKAKLTDREHQFNVEYINDRSEFYYKISWEY